MTEWLTEIIAGVGVAVFLGFAGWVGRKALQDIRDQFSPNGGSSLYDQVEKAREAAEKALECSSRNDERLRGVEQKVDAIILSGLPGRR